ncbi:hypothetical protein VTN00DRAFT_7345 [Thermoascus crustaceus]|uniref:uncharacterized protein n=1 Tax=Thermoascus crustaceus TaxID=5088 RepID=UPI00374426DB
MSAPLARVITAHDAKSDKAVFTNAVGENVSFTGFPVPPGKPPSSAYALAYTTNAFPVQRLSPPSSTVPEADANLGIKRYSSPLADPSPLNEPSGTACTIIEVPPGSEAPMHRTVSLDYGVVVDGTTELVLGSGEKRVLNKGDVFVQRGTLMRGGTSRIPGRTKAG